MPRDYRKITLSVPWNIMLLTVGGLVSAFGLKAFAVPHELVSGGIFGVSLLVYYQTGWLSVGAWYALLCVPVAIVGWLGLSRRFVLYSLYGIAVTSLGAQFITYAAPVDNPLLAAIAAGTASGIGSGIMLRSLGSDGGLSFVSMVLYQKYNVKVGGFSLMFNAILFSFALVYRDLNTVLYSIMLVYVASGIIDYAMEFTNQRKLVFIISDHAENITSEVMERLHRGVTYLYTKGAYTNQERYLVMTVIHNYQLKRLEELVYRVDPKAFLIIENTYNVLGRGFSERRVY